MSKIFRDKAYPRLTMFVGELSRNVSDLDFRTKVIAILEKTKEELKQLGADTLTKEDIQNLMLLCGQLLDQIYMLSQSSISDKIQKLISYLKECLELFEQEYIAPYYKRYGYLPKYPYYYYEYAREYPEIYGYYPPSYRYFDKYKPVKPNLENKEQLSQDIFDAVTTKEQQPSLWDRHDMDFESYMKYTEEQCEKRLNQLREQRQELEKRQELSKTDTDYILDWLADQLIKQKMKSDQQ